MRLTILNTELDNDGLYSLVKERSVNHETQMLDNACAVADIMRNVFRLHRQTEEHAYVIAVNKKFKPIGFFHLSHGSHDSSIVNPREIYIKLLLCGACGFFLVHNHPSGDCKPSKADLSVTQRVAECGKLLGVNFFDHIIIGGETFYSFAELSNVL